MNSLVLSIATTTLLSGDYLTQSPPGRIGGNAFTAGRFGVGVYNGSGFNRNGQSSTPNLGRQYGSRFTPRPPGGFGNSGRSMLSPGTRGFAASSMGGAAGIGNRNGGGSARGLYGGATGGSFGRSAGGSSRPQIPTPPMLFGGSGFSPNLGYRR